MDAATYVRWLTSAPRRPDIMTGVRNFAPTATGSDLAAPPTHPSYGGYAEDRSVYTQELFAPAGEEPRTVHLGLDIFAPAGTEIFTRCLPVSTLRGSTTIPAIMARPSSSSIQSMAARSTHSTAISAATA